MDSKEQSQDNRVFALSLEPMDYQLTVHYHNYAPGREVYGHRGADFMADFEYVRRFNDMDTVQRSHAAMFNLISYYGPDKIQQWYNTFINRNVA